MALIVAWVVYPLALAALSLGCGLLVQRAAGRALPGALLVPVGFAALVVASSFTTMSRATAPLTTPLVAGLGLAGFAFSARLRPRLDRWAVGAAVAVFAVYAAPIVLSGDATFAGYLTLGDSANWTALADNALGNGRSLGGLRPSSYSVILHEYLSSGYPLGSFLPLGIGRQLTRQDTAWLFQPQIAFMAAILGLAIYTLSAPLLRSRPLRAAVAFVGSQSTLLYGYAFWSGIKEVTVAALVGVLAALVASPGGRPWRLGDVVPMALVAAAVLDSLAVTGAVWLAAPAVLAVALLASAGPRRGSLLAVALGGITLVLAIPALAVAQVFVRVASAGGSRSITSTSDVAALVHPLSTMQLFGIWPVGDFRGRPANLALTYLLIGVLVAAGAFGLVTALRRMSWGVPVYLGSALAGCFAVIGATAVGHGSPWLNGKALAMASPALVVAAVAGAAVMLEGGRRVAAAVCLAAIVGGVGWSNALAYRNVWLAPRARFAELAAIGSRFAGEGPTWLTDDSLYGCQDFLRRLAPECAVDGPYPMNLVSGDRDYGSYVDPDAFELGSLFVYRTIVEDRSPLESRPPSAYKLVWTGRWYEVWQRPARATRILEHLALGDPADPVAVAPCPDVRRLAARASRSGGTLVAAERAETWTFDLTPATHPASWQPIGTGELLPKGSGTATLTITVPRSGVYGFWLAGSFRDRLELELDGRPLGSMTDQIDEHPELSPFGSARLSAGRHRVELRYGGPSLRPGSGGGQFGFGPLVVGVPAGDERLVRVNPASATSLCGKRLDWIEAVAP